MGRVQQWASWGSCRVLPRHWFTLTSIGPSPHTNSLVSRSRASESVAALCLWTLRSFQLCVWFHSCINNFLSLFNMEIIGIALPVYFRSILRWSDHVIYGWCSLVILSKTQLLYGIVRSIVTGKPYFSMGKHISCVPPQVLFPFTFLFLFP